MHKRHALTNDLISCKQERRYHLLADDVLSRIRDKTRDYSFADDCERLGPVMKGSKQKGAKFNAASSSWFPVALWTPDGKLIDRDEMEKVSRPPNFIKSLNAQLSTFASNYRELEMDKAIGKSALRYASIWQELLTNAKSSAINPIKTPVQHSTLWADSSTSRIKTRYDH